MKIFITGLILLCFIIGSAQTIQLGAGNTTNGSRVSSPVNIWYRRVVSQFVYTAAEINAGGVSGEAMLSDFGFYVTQVPIYNIPNYTIKMKNVSVANVASAIPQNGWTEVKAAHTYSPSAGGYDMFSLDTPFYWDGVSNIAVEICWSQISPNYNASGRLREYNATSGYRYSWTDSGGNSCGETPGTTRNRKPQCQIEFTPVLTSFWTGNINTDWFNNGNWTSGVPLKSINAQIPSGLSTYPVIVGGGAEVKSILIESNASISTAGTLSVYGDWTNNGNYIALAGKLNFKLLISQPNNLNGVNDQNLNNITVDNSFGVVLNSGSYNVFGALSPEGGDIHTNGRLTIASSAVSTGRITEIKSKCNYDLDMDDTYGDGWNGGYLTVLEDGVIIGTYSATGFGSNASFSITSGNNFDIQYTSASWENENSYSIYDSQGNLVFNDGTNPSTGTVFSSVANCSASDPFVGDVEQQRFLDLSNEGWRELTSPIIGQTLADWQNDGLIMSNFPGSNYPNFGWSSVYTYEENQANGIKEDGWSPATNISNSLSFEKGHRIYIGAGNFTVAVKGDINSGGQQVNLDYQNSLASEIGANENQKGWNLVGNPYPCPIDWDEIDAGRKINVDNAIWIWSADAGNYGVYVGNSGGVGTNGVNKNIASSQAFWLHANSGGASLSYVEKDKIDANTTFVKSFANNDFIKFSISSGLNNYKDEMLISFVENSTVGYDLNLDADKLGSPIHDAPEISTVSDNMRDLSLNRIPLDEELYLPIKTTVGVSGVYEIGVSNFDISDVNSCLVLEDLYLDSLIFLEDSITYSFYQSDTTNSPRFLLHVLPSVHVNVVGESCADKNDGKVSFQLTSENPYLVLWNNGSNIDSIEVSSLNYTIDNLEPGTYTLSSDHPMIGCAAYTVDVVVPEIAPIVVQLDSVLSCATCNVTGYNYSATGGAAPYSFYINNEATNYVDNINGEYFIEVVDVNGCSVNELLEINSSYSAIESLNMEKVVVYPNPVSSILNIEVNNQENLILYNLIGEVVHVFEASNTLIKLDVSTYSPGVYWLISKDGEYIEKIEVIH